MAAYLQHGGLDSQVSEQLMQNYNNFLFLDSLASDNPAQLSLIEGPSSSPKQPNSISTAEHLAEPKPSDQDDEANEVVYENSKQSAESAENIEGSSDSPASISRPAAIDIPGTKRSRFHQSSDTTPLHKRKRIILHLKMEDLYLLGI